MYHITISYVEEKRRKKNPCLLAQPEYFFKELIHVFPVFFIFLETFYEFKNNDKPPKHVKQDLNTKISHSPECPLYLCPKILKNTK